MKKINNLVANIVESVAVNGGIKPASVWNFHQPRVPKIK